MGLLIVATETLFERNLSRTIFSFENALLHNPNNLFVLNYTRALLRDKQTECGYILNFNYFTLLINIEL